MALGLFTASRVGRLHWFTLDPRAGLVWILSVLPPAAINCCPEQ